MSSRARRRLLIVKAGSTLFSLVPRRGDYEDWIAAGMGVARSQVDVASVYRGEPLPDPDRLEELAGVVVTGSPAMVSARADWSERTADWLVRLVETRTPLLGICYGHQLLAHALSGRVGPNPRGREMGTVEVSVCETGRGDRLLGGFAPGLRAQATHVESVLELPAGARLLAATALDPHAAFAVGRAAWGVQFHPEFDADVMREYLRARREALRAEGLDADALLAAASETPDGPVLLRRFASLLRD